MPFLHHGSFSYNEIVRCTRVMAEEEEELPIFCKHLERNLAKSDLFSLGDVFTEQNFLKKPEETMQ